MGAARADEGEGRRHFGMLGREEGKRVAGVEEPDGCLRRGCGGWWHTNKGRSGTESEGEREENRGKGIRMRRLWSVLHPLLWLLRLTATGCRHHPNFINIHHLSPS